MLRFHQVNKVAYDLYAQGYPPADVRQAICKITFDNYDNVEKFKKDVQDYCNKNKPLDKEHP